MTRLPVPGGLGPVDYAGAIPPSEYHCGKCGALGIKLWREYQAFLNHQSLLCAACACGEQSNDRKSYSICALDTGKVSVTTTYNPQTEPKLHEIFGGSSDGGDQIGRRIPAVPTEDGSSYWGYSSVPDAACAWWYRLPLKTGGAP